ncbi:MAG TPA: hypothetical protein PKY81_09280 [bacterium]|nr:hypothetical protein [bacterium]
MIFNKFMTNDSTNYIDFFDNDSYMIIKFKEDLTSQNLQEIYNIFYDYNSNHNFNSCCYFIFDFTGIEKIDYKGLLFLISLTKSFAVNTLLDFVIKKDQKIINIFRVIDYFQKFDIKESFNY